MNSETDDEFYLFNDEENPNSIINEYKRSPILRFIAQETYSRKLILNSDHFFEQKFISEMETIFPGNDLSNLTVQCREIGPAKLDFISKIITLYLSRKISLPDFIQKLALSIPTERSLFMQLIHLILVRKHIKLPKSNSKGEQKKIFVNKPMKTQTEEKGNELSDEEILELLEQDEDELEEEDLRDILYTLYNQIPFDVSSENMNPELMSFLRERFDSIISDYQFHQKVSSESGFAPRNKSNDSSSDASDYHSQHSQNNTKSIGKPSDFIMPAKLLLAVYGDITYGTELEYLIKHFSINNALIMPPPIAPIIRTFMNFCAEANSSNKSKDVPELSIIQDAVMKAAAESFNATLSAVKTAKKVSINSDAANYLNILIEQMNEVFSDPNMVEFTKRIAEKNEVKEANFLHSKYGDTLIRLSLSKSGQKTILSEEEIITTTCI